MSNIEDNKQEGLKFPIITSLTNNINNESFDVLGLPKDNFSLDIHLPIRDYPDGKVKEIPTLMVDDVRVLITLTEIKSKLYFIALPIQTEISIDMLCREGFRDFKVLRMAGGEILIMPEENAVISNSNKHIAERLLVPDAGIEFKDIVDVAKELLFISLDYSLKDRLINLIKRERKFEISDTSLKSLMRKLDMPGSFLEFDELFDKGGVERQVQTASNLLGIPATNITQSGLDIEKLDIYPLRTQRVKNENANKGEIGTSNVLQNTSLPIHIVSKSDPNKMVLTTVKDRHNNYQNTNDNKSNQKEFEYNKTKIKFNDKGVSVDMNDKLFTIEINRSKLSIYKPMNLMEDMEIYPLVKKHTSGQRFLYTVRFNDIVFMLVVIKVAETMFCTAYPLDYGLLKDNLAELDKITSFSTKAGENKGAFIIIKNYAELDDNTRRDINNFRRFLEKASLEYENISLMILDDCNSEAEGINGTELLTIIDPTNAKVGNEVEGVFKVKPNLTEENTTESLVSKLKDLPGLNIATPSKEDRDILANEIKSVISIAADSDAYSEKMNGVTKLLEELNDFRAYVKKQMPPSYFKQEGKPEEELIHEFVKSRL